MKVVFCWPDISGYMAACWRALHACAGIDLFVVAFAPASGLSFSSAVMQGIPCRLLSSAERQDNQAIRAIVLEQRPSVVFVSGWFHKPYRNLVFDPALTTVRFVMGMDTPWSGTSRQHLARLGLRRYLARMDLVAVTGERSYQYARRLNVAPHRIVAGLYGIDYDALSAAVQRRPAHAWPRAFLFTGRYAEEKAIDVLVTAYQMYRTSVSEPWPLLCCGQGPLQHLLRNVPGVTDLGFVQPTAQPALYSRAGAFLLPSRFDPWPLALVEAAASGLPVVCSAACGSAVELIRNYYNGLVVPADDVDRLCGALLEIHACEQLPLWGQRATAMAEPYSSSLWAERWQRHLLHLV